MKIDYIKQEELRRKAQSEGKCTNCYKHKANNIPWVGEGGMMGYVHGAYSYWCDCCVLKAQVKYARASARRLKGLEIKLKKVKCGVNKE